MGHDALECNRPINHENACENALVGGFGVSGRPMRWEIEMIILDW
jgi:hypothetical protein